MLINNGRNAARDYLAIVSFYEAQGRPIAVRRVLTETLESYAFVAAPHEFTGDDRVTVVHRDIVLAYHDYQYASARQGDAVWAWGRLDALGYEMLLLTVAVPPDTREFFVVYMLTYHGKHLTPPTYIQACRVDHAGLCDSPSVTAPPSWVRWLGSVKHRVRRQVSG